jgi:MFS family permease
LTIESESPSVLASGQHVTPDRSGQNRTTDGEARFQAGRTALNAVNFFVAAMQTGFGPFVSVWLIDQGWTLTEVGVALSVGTVAALCGQIPGGMLVDAVRRKRNIAAIAMAAVAFSALAIALTPSIPAVWLSEVLHSLASAVIAPAIAAMTLSLCGSDSFGERLGGNARYASLGSALAAGAFGFAAMHLGQRSIFFITAGLALPAMASLLAVRQGSCPPSADDHMAIAAPADRDTRPWNIFRDPAMHIFALCVILFHLSNAALLPLALGELSEHGEASGFVVSAAIVVPQIVVALCSPWAGAAAQSFGRRKVLLVGFLALPVRALLFAAGPGPETLDAIELLDGVSATVLGLMLPLIAADLTRRNGHLNLAIGAFGLAAGLGATFSTTAAGFIADRMGAGTAFLGLALVGGLAILLLVLAMPETRPRTLPAQ